MSIHRSLQTRSALVRSRNVLTRYERILALRKSGEWKDEVSSPLGLRKVRVMKVKKRGKAPKKAEGEAVAAAAAAGAGGAAAGGAAGGGATAGGPGAGPAAKGAKAGTKAGGKPAGK